MTKTIALLGSTGSIGRQTLQVARELKEQYDHLILVRQQRGATGSAGAGILPAPCGAL